MRQGFHVIDADTHVNPSLDVLLRYADPSFRTHLDELKPYMLTVKPRPGQGDAENLEQTTILSIKPVRYQRVAGDKPGSSPDAGGQRGFLRMTSCRSPASCGARSGCSPKTVRPSSLH